MSKQQKDDAKILWAAKASAYANDMCISKDYAPLKPYIKTDYLNGIEDFKTSLKAAIDKEKVSRGVHGHYADGRMWAFEKALELIETVTP